MAQEVLVVNDGNVVEQLLQPPGKSDEHTNRHDRLKSTVLHRSLHADPLRVLSAKGNHLHLSNGQRIFDATGGAAVACLGHGDERYEQIVSTIRLNVAHSMLQSKACGYGPDGKYLILPLVVLRH